MAVLGIAVLLIVGTWVIAGPLRAANNDAAAISALLRGDSGSALSKARSAVAANPLALDPRFELSAIYQARGQAAAARRELVGAVNLQPDNPASWQALGTFDLQQHRPALALAELQHARSLAPMAFQILPLIQAAEAELAR